MAWNMPDGCTAEIFERFFGESGPSPAELAAEADAQNDLAAEDELDYPEDDYLDDYPDDDESERYPF